MHVKAQPPRAFRPAASRGAARAGPPGLQRLARAAQAYSESMPLAGLAAKATAPLQRKVTIGGKPVEKRTEEKKGAGENWRLRDAGEDMPSTDKDLRYYSDDWERSFRDMAQYRAYSEKSAPVSVGLIEPYAEWYNIPYIETGTFFVLG